MKAGIHPEYRDVVFQDVTSDFKILTRRVTVPEPVQTARALFAAGRALLTGADAAAQRSSLGLGTAATASGAARPP